jgi:preprotein translocase subunit SecY
VVAIASFLIHLAIIYLIDLNIITLNSPSVLLSNPIAAIYTPFSFILVYEVYLLIYYLPKSFSTYISKQYEIIALIVIRRLFKDLSNLSISSDWFKIKYDMQFTYDLLASMLLFYLIFLFRKESNKRFPAGEAEESNDNGLARFIKTKKILAASLVPVIVLVSVYSFVNWLLSTLQSASQAAESFKNINNVFFEQFFTILIVVDVILLLFSFFHTDEFHKIIRNSGFIISTILIRMSFSVDGLLNTLLITSAIVFGLIILGIYNQYEKHLAAENTRL